MTSQSKAYFGSKEFIIHESTELHAGPLTMTYENGIIHSIKLGEKEILRRIYVSVRDENWNSILSEISQFSLQQDSNSFSITFVSRNRRNSVDFLWDGKITGDSSGTITFQMNGKAVETFLRNRIGFCILHPATLASHVCKITHSDNTTTEGVFPSTIAPFALFKNIQTVTTQVLPSTELNVHCSGDIFEMEDQRNWSDASFKTYCTPIELPVPVEIKQGTTIQQTVTVSLKNSETISHPTFSKKPITITVAPGALPIPAIGFDMAANRNLSKETITQLGNLSPRFLRFTVNCDNQYLVSDLTAVGTICNQLDITTELALFFGSDFESQLEHLLGALRAVDLPVRRFIILSTLTRVTPSNLVESVKKALKAYAPHAQIGSGTDNYFVEINRTPPEVTGIDFISFSVNPQVHTFDNLSVMQNIQGQSLLLESAHALVPSTLLAISPITLRPRKFLNNPHKDGGPDKRLHGLFGAAWTVGSIAACAQKSVTSITYFAPSGDEGIIEKAGKKVYPVYHVFADLFDYKGGLISTTYSSAPETITGFILTKDSISALILANISCSQQTITIYGFENQVTVAILDETTISEAISEPTFFRCHRVIQLNLVKGTFTITLNPYATARIEGTIP